MKTILTNALMYWWELDPINTFEPTIICGSALVFLRENIILFRKFSVILKEENLHKSTYFEKLPFLISKILIHSDRFLKLTFIFYVFSKLAATHTVFIQRVRGIVITDFIWAAFAWYLLNVKCPLILRF